MTLVTMTSRERAFLDPSPDVILCDVLVRRLGVDGAHRAVDALVAQFSAVELASLATFSEFWFRPKQRPPMHDWSSWGFLTARGFGKTEATARHLAEGAESGLYPVISMAAQNETKTVAVQVEGLIRASPPWFRPEWSASSSVLTWPNGAVAYAFTPESPDAIRSPSNHACWLSELQSWPTSSREEAYSNFIFATRIGKARTIWDATPKRGHPILKRLLAMSAADPIANVVVRGTIYENPHLTRKALEKMVAEYGGTAKGREELEGEMLPETERAMVKQSWIDSHRRARPEQIVRRVISVDPSITTRAGSDRTAIIDACTDASGQMYVMGDRTAKHSPAEWGSIVIDLYVRGDADLVLVETNRGGDLVVSNLRAIAQQRSTRIVVIGRDERPPPRVRGVIFVREVHARGPKEDRATPLATAYERGRVSHVVGVDLADLEEVLTTWEPQAGKRSPDPLDALAHAATELMGLLRTEVTDPKRDIDVAVEIAKKIANKSLPPQLGALLSGPRSGTRGGGI